MPSGVYKRTKPRSEEHKEKIRLANLGHKVSAETREKLRLAFLGKFAGDKHPFYGKHHSAETRQKISLICKGKQSNEKHWGWKGDNVGYTALHEWVRKNLPQPEYCEMCHEKPSKHLANVTHVYNRELHNWKYLCARCHEAYDTAFKLII